MHLSKPLIQQFNTQTPRYTSYPTVPAWTSAVGISEYHTALGAFDAADRPLSVYVHLPFCEKMCYYCGCNVVIRKKHEVADEYLDHLEQELHLIRQSLTQKKRVVQLHFGGGTPNYLDNAQMDRLFALLNTHFEIDESAEVSIEVDPRTVTQSQVSHYPSLGINRLSMGLQDFDATVQEAVNRIQPYDTVSDLFNWARAAGITGINIDLIYGLPFQTVESFSQTITLVNQLSPNRIALYSYAHVPWLKSHQTLIKESDLPSADEKIDIFLMSRDTLLSHGYDAIGMDHFAKSTDELATAYKEGWLYRNFMGYTIKPADDFIGLGVSSIGFINGTYVQNTADLKTYYQQISEGMLASHRGLVLTPDDLIRHDVITTLMCQFQITKATFGKTHAIDFDTYFSAEQDQLTTCESQGLIDQTADTLKLTELGRLFVRNVVTIFDNTSPKPKPGAPRFSKAI